MREHPYSRYIGEAYVKIARIRKQGRDQALGEGLRKLREGDNRSGLSSLRKALNQTDESLRYFKTAIKKDPYSVWAEYALDDMKKERDYFQKKQSIIYSLCNEEDVRRSIESIVSHD